MVHPITTPNFIAWGHPFQYSIFQKFGTFQQLIFDQEQDYTFRAVLDFVTMVKKYHPLYTLSPDPWDCL